MNRDQAIEWLQRNEHPHYYCNACRQDVPEAEVGDCGNHTAESCPAGDGGGHISTSRSCLNPELSVSAAQAVVALSAEVQRLEAELLRSSER